MASTSYGETPSEVRRRRAARLNFELPSFSLGIDTEPTEPIRSTPSFDEGAEASLKRGEEEKSRKPPEQSFEQTGNKGWEDGHPSGNEKSWKPLEPSFEHTNNEGWEDGHPSGNEKQGRFKRLKRGPSSISKEPLRVTSCSRDIPKHELQRNGVGTSDGISFNRDPVSTVDGVRKHTSAKVQDSFNEEVDEIEDFSDDENFGFGSRTQKGCKSLRPQLFETDPVLITSSPESLGKPVLHIPGADSKTRVPMVPLQVSHSKIADIPIVEEDTILLDDFQSGSDWWRQTRPNLGGRGQTPQQHKNASLVSQSTDSVDNLFKTSQLDSDGWRQTRPNLGGRGQTPQQHKNATLVSQSTDSDYNLFKTSQLDSDWWRQTRPNLGGREQTPQQHKNAGLGSQSTDSEDNLFKTSQLDSDWWRQTRPNLGGREQTPQQHKNAGLGSQSTDSEDNLFKTSQLDSDWWRQTRPNLGGREQTPQQHKNAGLGSQSTDSEDNLFKTSQLDSDWWRQTRPNPGGRGQTPQQRKNANLASQSTNSIDNLFKTSQLDSAKKGNLKGFYTVTPPLRDTVGPSQAIRNTEVNQLEEHRILAFLRQRFPHYKPVDALLVDGGLDNEPVYIDYRRQFADGKGGNAGPQSGDPGPGMRWPAVRSIHGAFSSSPPSAGPSQRRKKATAKSQPKKQKPKKGSSSASGNARAGKRGPGGPVEGKWRTLNGSRVYIVGGNRMTGQRAYAAYKGRGNSSKKRSKKRPTTKAK